MSSSEKVNKSDFLHNLRKKVIRAVCFYLKKMRTEAAMEPVLYKGEVENFAFFQCLEKKS